MTDKEEILKELNELEWEKLYDSHPEVHKLVIDFIMDKFELVIKPDKKVMAGMGV